MPEIQIRKRLITTEEIFHEGGPVAGTPLRRGAIVAVEGDDSGAVRAMVGGRDYGASPFNRATQARRQPA